LYLSTQCDYFAQHCSTPCSSQSQQLYLQPLVLHTLNTWFLSITSAPPTASHSPHTQHLVPLNHTNSTYSLSFLHTLNALFLSITLTSPTASRSPHTQRLSITAAPPTASRSLHTQRLSITAAPPTASRPPHTQRLVPVNHINSTYSLSFSKFNTSFLSITAAPPTASHSPHTQRLSITAAPPTASHSPHTRRLVPVNHSSSTYSLSFSTHSTPRSCQLQQLHLQPLILHTLNALFPSITAAPPTAPHSAHTQRLVPVNQNNST